MSEHRKWTIGYIAAFALMLFFNYLSATNVSAVANDNQTIIQPAGYAFSIWGVIYILMLIWLIRLFFEKSWEDSVVRKLKFWPIANFLLNGLWIVVFTQQLLIASVLVIGAVLFTLARMHVLLTEKGYHWFDRLPISVYYSWVTIATVVNIFTLIVSSDIGTLFGMGELPWTIIILVAATLIITAIALRFKDWLYPLIALWPFFAIYTKNDGMYRNLDVTLLITGLMLSAVAIFVAVSKLLRQKAH
ncbi:tryptophan-rich sensory protein [Salinicoccus siamensis]|uniref:Tryptophan-rich sensory protein n=1 Tax=Salinicoccus siamensis TaxID=381830 RepID=A0ABV5Z545_9STAP